MIRNVSFAKENKVIQVAVAEDTDLELLEAIKNQFGADQILSDEISIDYELIDGIWIAPPSIGMPEIAEAEIADE